VESPWPFSVIVVFGLRWAEGKNAQKVLVGLAELDAVSGIGLIRVELGNAVGKGARIERWISNCIIVEW